MDYITATAGIGTNLYLCKIAMDTKTKVTKFWRVGQGIADKQAEYGIPTQAR